MSAPVTPAPVVVVAREDLVTVAVPGNNAPREALRVARKVAAGAAHGLVGGAQNARNAVHEDRRVTLVDFAPVRRRQAGTPVAPAPVPAPVATGDAAKLVARIAKLQAQLAALTGEAPAPAPARELPDFIKRAQAVTCHTCRDHGLVRGVGARAGQPYRTADGAKAAKAAGRAVKCPTHKRASRTA